MKRIIYKWNDAGVVFFPVGKIDKGGTCEFATVRCLHRCPERGVAQQPYRDIYAFITTTEPLTVSTRISREMSEIGVTILSWFASGDCTTKDQNHIIAIMKRLSLTGVIQHGFTRNIKFWKKVQEIKKVYMALTVESKKKKDEYIKYGLVVIPNYKEGFITLYRMRKHTLTKSVGHSTCGGVFYTDEKIGTEMREAHCQVCYEKMEGCFLKRGQRDG